MVRKLLSQLYEEEISGYFYKNAPLLNTSFAKYGDEGRNVTVVCKTRNGGKSAMNHASSFTLELLC